VAWIFVCWEATALAQEELPALRPPLGEIPPTFWELHGTTVILLAVLALLLVGLGVWLWLRPKPVVPVPPEVAARKALEALANRLEDGALLSRVSQILRRYIQAAFELPPGETTTGEFCELIAGHDQIGPELSEALARFLHESDARKFALSNPSAPLGAAARALELVALGETRRTQLRQLATAQARQTVGASA